MLTPLTPNRHVWEKQQSKSWNGARLNRSRRPLLLAFCTVVFFLWWYHSRSSHSGHTFHLRNPGPRGPEKRSIPGQDQILLPKTPAELLAAPQSSREQLLQEDAHLHSDEHAQEEEEDNLHGVQLGENQHLEHAHIGDHDESLVQASELKAQKASSENGIDPQGLRLQKTSEEQESTHPIDPKLDPNIEKAPVISQGDQPSQEKVSEAESEDHLSLEEKGDVLPDLVHRPFEDSVKDFQIEAWMDDWIAHASFNSKKSGKLEEPKIDFVYLWVNGSEKAFQTTKRPFELNSVLNDPEGKWINSHGTNRYRDWDELRYSLRSIEKNARSFRNKIQILVNSVQGSEAGKQIPTWLNDDPATKEVVQVLSQEEFFDAEKHVCLPTFNSLTIENQIFNTPSDTDQLFALSDDMLLGRPHAPSDIYSPLFGPVMGFKTNAYSTVNPPTEVDAHRFGEKPFLIYTSWLLNRRFGIRKRRGQGHFGHSLSRSVTREAIGSFPGPELHSACKRFRGEPGFQLYSWYATFHYTIERHREALLWSYIMLRSDADGNENLSWSERQQIMKDLENGMKNEGKASFRKRNFYHVAQLLERAGLEGPKVNTDIQWTSLDGPITIQGIDCLEFDVNECLAPGFSTSSSDETSRNPIFSTALVFDRVARQNPKCGDCLIKLLLNQVPRGLSPMLPRPETQAAKREIVVKALMRYRYTIINPDALFVMVTDAEQIDSTLVNRFIRSKKDLAGQLCLNDDVATEDEKELDDVQQVMTELYQGLFPEKSPFEI